VSEPDEKEFQPVPIWASARRHPVITGVLVTFTITGAIVGATLLGDDWSLVRRIAGGGVAGAGCALLLTAYRTIGLSDYRIIG